MKKISIEYAHIYMDELFGIEQIKGIEKLKEVEAQIKQDSVLASSRVVLIDDYSPVEKILEVQHFIDELARLGGAPDTFYMESDLVPHTRYTIDAITNGRLKRSYEKYIEKHKYVPCSLFIATWYLVRLDLIPKLGLEIEPVDELITILPKRYKGVEGKGIDIIANSVYAEAAARIKQVFFEEQQYERIPKY